MEPTLIEVYRFSSAYESILNFDIILGNDNQSTNIAIEGTVKENIIKVGTYIKTFFQKLFHAIRNFFVTYFIGEERVDDTVYSEIKNTLNEFMEAFHEECLYIVSTKNYREIYTEGIQNAERRLTNIIRDHDIKMKPLLNNVDKLKYNPAYNRSSQSKHAAIPIKNCRTLLERSQTSMHQTLEKVYSFYVNQLNVSTINNDSSDPMNNSVSLQKKICELFISTMVIKITDLFRFLTKSIDNGVIRFYAKDIKENK